jgi:hypothetical protein
MTKRLRLAEGGLEGGDSGKGEAPKITTWDITVDGETDGETDPEDGSEAEKVEACEMGLDGNVIVGVGSKGTVWVWSVPPES